MTVTKAWSTSSLRPPCRYSQRVTALRMLSGTWYSSGEIDRTKRQIRLTMKQAPEIVEAEPEGDEEVIPSAMEFALRRALEGSESEPAEAPPPKAAAPKPAAPKAKANRSTQEDILARTLRHRIK